MKDSRREYHRQYSYEHYNNDPEFRAKVKQYQHDSHERLKLDPERLQGLRDYQRGYRARQRLRPNVRAKEMRKNAMKRDLEWEISIEDAASILCMPCSYCGELDRTGTTGSIDRSNDEYPYLHWNVIPACVACTTMRNKTHKTRKEFVRKCSLVHAHNTLYKNPSGYMSS
jgi:hypothetical protein